MKSISKIVVVAAALLFASTASAGTLYWQVADGAPDIGAELWMLDTSKEEGAEGYKTSLSDGLIDAPTGIQQADITNYTGDQYLFFVELYNYSDGTSTEGYKWGYGDLVSAGYVASDVILEMPRRPMQTLAPIQTSPLRLSLRVVCCS